ncbi:MAG: hypothetical protein EOM76_04075 [Sphingobacteriia bacterium]|nr:hypothetical protein [Sphingobacteriia bacterium]
MKKVFAMFFMVCVICSCRRAGDGNFYIEQYLTDVVHNSFNCEYLRQSESIKSTRFMGEDFYTYTRGTLFDKPITEKCIFCDKCFSSEREVRKYIEQNNKEYYRLHPSSDMSIVKIFYDNITRGFNVGDFDTFVMKVQDINKVNILYNGLIEHGLTESEIGDYDTFVKNIQSATPKRNSKTKNKDTLKESTNKTSSWRDSDIQQVLYDFNTTLLVKGYDSQTMMSKFPEFNNDKELLQAAYDYSATLNSGKYKTIDELNSKFPEFFHKFIPNF